MIDRNLKIFLCILLAFLLVFYMTAISYEEYQVIKFFSKRQFAHKFFDKIFYNNNETTLVNNKNDERVKSGNWFYDFSNESKKKKLAVIVPFRNAFEELIEFTPKLSKFLIDHKIPFQIYVIHQIDGYRFNRGSLINVGFQFVKNISDYIVIHDVDIYPINSNVSYEYPGDDQVYHIIPYYLHPNNEINYEEYLGSIVAVPNKIYEKVDGISNDYWGWGGEDDDFAEALKRHNISIIRPERTIKMNRFNSFNHIHNDKKRPRDKILCKGQDRNNFMTRRDNCGLNSTNYLIKNVQHLSIDNFEVILVNVVLPCNKSSTPWCECD